MQVVSPDLVKDKIILLRLDLDVPIEDGYVTEDFRLQAAIPTIKLCIQNASKVIIMGHIGRPKGADPNLSVASIYKWFLQHGFSEDLDSEKLRLLENLRFENGEDGCDIDYAKELALLGDFFVNEAFAAHHPAASTTVLPTLLPHAAGLRFFQEVKKLTQVRENPVHPLVVIIGGVKIEDKLPAIQALSKIADTVLVGGKIAREIAISSTIVEDNVIVGKLNEEGTDITGQTLIEWKEIIKSAKMIVWNGPIGRVESSDSSKGTYELAKLVLESDAKVLVGGGDTVGFLDRVGLLDQFMEKGFVSTGGGAMLEFLSKGTLPTIDALDKTL